MRRRMSSCSECCLSRKGHRTHFPLKKMERSVCMYVHMWVCTYRTQRGPERPREARRRAERPREAQRGPEKPRETQRGPKRPRKALYVHSRTIPGAFPQAELRTELPCYVCICMYMYIPGPFQEHSHKQNHGQNCLAICMYVYVYVCRLVCKLMCM